MDFHTAHKNGRKSGLLDGVVRHEFDPHFVAGRLDVLGNRIAAVDADLGTVGLVTVADLQVVVHAVVVVLDLERLELERHLEVGGHRDLPRALFVWLIVVGEVGRLQVASLHVQFPAAQRCVFVQ